jgi:hypothetical protein
MLISDSVASNSIYPIFYACINIKNELSSLFLSILDTVNTSSNHTLLRAAEIGLYRVHWSQKILDETTRCIIDGDNRIILQAKFAARLPEHSVLKTEL